MTHLTETQRRTLLDMARSPDVAWPTIVLFVVAFGGWLFSFFGHHTGILPWWAAILISFLSLYALYMVMHEAAHSSLTRNRTANLLIGGTAALAFFSPYGVYKWAHLRHHFHTNDPDHDPDHFSALVPRLWHWALQDFHYGWLYFSEPRSAREVLPVLGSYAVVATIFVAAIWWGAGWSLLIAWIIPWRLVIPWLAFALNYLPHAPHDVIQRNNRFAATVCRQPRWLKWVLFFQNYHIVHHLYPTAPFYRAEKMWIVGKNYFVDSGTRIV